MVKLGYGGKIVAFGVLHDAAPGNDFCNGNIAIGQAPDEVACLVDCLHIDDVAELLNEKGLGTRPSEGGTGTGAEKKDDQALTDIELAEEMFKSYNAQAGGKTWDGKDIPPFSECGEKVRANWEAAARRARELLVPQE